LINQDSTLSEGKSSGLKNIERIEDFIEDISEDDLKLKVTTVSNLKG
jgi:hypothetical protein